MPAATAATSELDSSAELDLPQLAAMTSLPPAIETVVASPRPAGSTRPDDVDLDLDDLHGEPSEPPIAPAPASEPEASGSSSSRNSPRPSMRPRPRRLVPQVVQPPPPAIAYVGLVTLAAGLLGLWWLCFTRGPGLAADGTQRYQFVYNANQHDTTAKTFSFPIYPDGRKTIDARAAASGMQDGLDLIDALVAHPETPRYIGAKLYRFFVSETGTVPDSFLDRLSAA